MAARKKTTTDATEPAAPVGKDARSQIGALLASDILAGTLKVYGKKSLIDGAEIKARKTKRIPTGVFALDYALAGGWAVGGIHTLIGHKSSGKTTILFRTIGEAQKLCGNCWGTLWDCGCDNPREPVIAYLDVEGALDAQWASRFFDLDKVVISIPEYAEQTIAISEALLRSKRCDILVLDSLAFMTTQQEIEEAVEKDQMGVQARKLGKGIRKFTAALNECMSSEGKRPTVFFTNQIRMKLGIMFGNPETAPGGLAPGFAAWTEVKTKAAKYKMDDEGQQALYGDFGFTIEKAKNSVPRASYDYRMIVAETNTKRLGDIYDEDFILAQCERLNIVSGGGSSWRCLDEQFRKKTEIEDKIVQDKAFRKMLTDLLISSVQPTL